MNEIKINFFARLTLRNYKKLSDKKTEKKLENEQSQSERILKKYEKLNNQVLFLQAEKSAYNIKGENN